MPPSVNNRIYQARDLRLRDHLARDEEGPPAARQETRRVAWRRTRRSFVCRAWKGLSSACPRPFVTSTDRGWGGIRRSASGCARFCEQRNQRGKECGERLWIVSDGIISQNLSNPHSSGSCTLYSGAAAWCLCRRWPLSCSPTTGPTMRARGYKCLTLPPALMTKSISHSQLFPASGPAAVRYRANLECQPEGNDRRSSHV